MFSISEPFHLLLNNTEYLPPVEDVRVLKENETILVIPGSGLNNTVSEVGEISNASSYNGTDLSSPKTQKITQKTFESISKDKFKNTIDITRPSSMNTTRDMTFYSVINDTINDTINTEGTSEDDTESKTTENNLIEDCDVTQESNASSAKRKRVRKRKPKNKSQSIMLHNETEETEGVITKEPSSKKPKIINSFTIPSGKHIRFNNTEDENKLAKEIVQEISGNESYLNKISSLGLSTLLALRHSSTPKTFVKKCKNGIETENSKTETLTEDLENNTEKIVLNNIRREMPPQKGNSLESLETDLESLPIMTRKPEINDIIAFKILKLGGDYTPQISKYIITKVIKVDAAVNPFMYTLIILRGKEEVNLPSGKFSISDDSEYCSDVATLKLDYSEMRDIRLIQ
ncbi:hypothetical protein PUN28_003540 [Cardiocondyla obscurior]